MNLPRRFPVKSVANYVVGIILAVALPWFIYPPVALDVMVWALFAISLDLCFGLGGMLSFGHAMFWGVSAYTAGNVAIMLGLPFPVCVLIGALTAAVLGLIVAFISVRTTGVYFAMVTLALAQTVFFLANQAGPLTGGENGLQGIPRELFGVDISDPFYFYYSALPIILLGIWFAARLRASPFGRVSVAIREDAIRAEVVGFRVSRYKIALFTISAGLAGVAGSLFAMGHSFVSLKELSVHTSGIVLVMVVLGGIGTQWGPVIGAALVVLLQDQLAAIGFEYATLVTGALFVVIILTMRQGIWGTVIDVAERISRRRKQATITPESRTPVETGASR